MEEKFTTVGELIALLQEHDPDRAVLMSRDPEGNGHGPLHGMWPAAFTKRWGEIQLGLEAGELDEKMRDAGWDEDDVLEGDDVRAALVLAPGY